MSPLKIIYNRKPKFLFVFAAIDCLLERNVTLPPSFRLLFLTYISMLNGCGFCQDVQQALAVQRRVGLEKFNALRDHRTSPLFDERERSALAFAEEFSDHRQVGDETFDLLKKNFTDTEIIEIIWMNAAENYFNALLVPLKIKAEGVRLLAEERRGR